MKKTFLFMLVLIKLLFIFLGQVDIILLDYTFEESNRINEEDPELFKEKVQESLRRHAAAINKHTAKGTYFFDYGNAFLLEAHEQVQMLWLKIRN